MTELRTAHPSQSPEEQATARVTKPENVNVAGVRALGSNGVDVDHMSRRSDADALVGHFVSIDLSNTAAKKAVEEIVGEGNAHFGSGDYGVLVGVGEYDEKTGYPVLCTVMTRDDHAVQIPNVPYDALSPATAGRR